MGYLPFCKNRLESFGQTGIVGASYHKIQEIQIGPPPEAPFEVEKRGEIPLLTSSAILLSSPQKLALQSPCSEGKYVLEILKPHFLKERCFFNFQNAEG
jgi:hypothetical protein